MKCRFNAKIAGVVILAAMLAGCAGQKKIAEQPQIIAKVYPRVTISAEKENLRVTPNGEKVGEAIQGESFDLLMCRANWCQLRHESLGEVWIWAPSLEGYKSVNPLYPYSWLGDGESIITADDVNELFGPPSNVELVGHEMAVYHYKNYQPEGTSLFGTRKFKTVKLWVDRATRETVKMEILLPPYEGKREQLLRWLGLSDRKSSGVDFESARYYSVFKGIATLQVFFYQGHFERIDRVSVERFNNGLWRRDVEVGREVKAVIMDNGKLAVELPLMNDSRKFAYAAPILDVMMVEGSRELGRWELGPGAIRIEPGEAKALTIATPVDTTGLNIKRVGVRASILEMMTLPPKGAQGEDRNMQR